MDGWFLECLQMRAATQQRARATVVLGKRLLGRELGRTAVASVFAVLVIAKQWMCVCCSVERDCQYRASGDEGCDAMLCLSPPMACTTFTRVRAAIPGLRPNPRWRSYQPSCIHHQTLLNTTTHRQSDSQPTLKSRLRSLARLSGPGLVGWRRSLIG